MIQNELLSLVLLLLAALGVFALLARLGRSMLRLGLNAAEATAASGLAEVSERRGDITGFMERRASGETLRRARRRNLASVAAYALLIAIPPFTPFARELYAASALL
ncbi:MAG TPA: hypothetical protein VF142_08240, partial [Longimicrobium sp.]